MTAYSWIPTDGQALVQAIDETSTTKMYPIGTLKRAFHTTYGECVFAYQVGLASTAVGDWALLDNYTPSTKRVVAGDRGPVGVAMSANVASQYGWYAVCGTVPANSATVADEGNVYLTATAGRCDDATVSGDKIDGARWKSADSSNLAVVALHFPSANGNG